MKFILLAVFIVSTYVLLFSGTLLGYFDTNLPINKIRYVSNQTDESISLYDPDSQSEKVLASLKLGRFLPSIYIEKYQDKNLVISNNDLMWVKENVDIGFNIFDGLFVSHRYLLYVFWISLVLSFLSTVYWVHQPFLYKRKLKDSLFENNSLYSRISKLKAEAKSWKNKFKSVNNELLILRHKNTKLDEIIKTKRLEFATKLKELVEQESKIREYEITIDEMKASYEKLEEEYAIIQSEAKYFDIDFTDTNYESVLKGRKYEYCVALSKKKKRSFKILEWSPDKGSYYKLNSESSQNPDLVVQHKSGLKLAIECKYRGDYFFKTEDNKKDYSWCYKSQSQRYKKFSNERNIPVLIALGAHGDAIKPDNNYLVDLDKLIDNSSEVKVNDNNIQLVVLAKDIFNNYVDNGNYSKYITEQIINTFA